MNYQDYLRAKRTLSAEQFNALRNLTVTFAVSYLKQFL
jgi:hypothetical protein